MDNNHLDTESVIERLTESDDDVVFTYLSVYPSKTKVYHYSRADMAATQHELVDSLRRSSGIIMKSFVDLSGFRWLTTEELAHRNAQIAKS